MRLLVLTGSIYPVIGNNANLLMKLLPALAGQHDIRILSIVAYENGSELPTRLNGFPVYWISRQAIPAFKRRYAFPTVSKLFDPHGNSDVLNVLYIKEALKSIKSEFDYDAILSTSEPYPAAVVAAGDRCGVKILYLMDPPELARNEKSTLFRNQSINRVLDGQTAIITTPFIREALLSAGMNESAQKTVLTGFPMIEEHSQRQTADENDTIKLLFSGWMCSQLRSPRYFLDIVSRLDERFEVTFMGRECELLQERFPTETRASIITLPNQPYEVALQAMADADVLINIGNSVPVHMPSKTLEYINTGKPFVNFYKMDDCPTLYYTKRYPLCLNMSERDGDIDAAARRFIDFCVKNKGNTVDRGFIETEYADCTPKYIAQKILDVLEA